MFNAETGQPVVNAVYGAVNDAVYRAAIAAAREDVDIAVYGAVDRAMYWEVEGALEGAVYWAVFRAVNNAQWRALDDPESTALQAFLCEASARGKPEG